MRSHCVATCIEGEDVSTKTSRAYRLESGSTVATMLRTIKTKQIKVLRRNKRDLNAIQRGVNVLPEQTVSLAMQTNHIPLAYNS